jgi:hypothetical protein
VSLRSSEARYAVYLVDPGSNRAGLLVLLQEVLGVNREAAAGYLVTYPSLISFYETESAARNLADRFRDFDAVAVVRPADKPLAPAPVEEVDATPAQRAVQWAILVLGVIQIGVSLLWFREGRWAAAFFGLCLAVYVLVYFGVRLKR